jgi:hypothetical protein
MLTDEITPRVMSVLAEGAIELPVDEQVHGLLYLDHLLNESVVCNARPCPLLLRQEAAPVIICLAAAGLLDDGEMHESLSTTKLL